MASDAGGLARFRGNVPCGTAGFAGYHRKAPVCTEASLSAVVCSSSGVTVTDDQKKCEKDKPAHSA